MTHRNHCGECTACCTVLGVKDLQKPEYTHCTHLCAGGCGIYEKRPTECQTYECLWLATNTREGEMPLELRPDQCGLIVEVQEVKFGQAVVVREVWPGAYTQSEEGQNYIWAVAKTLDALILLITDGGGRKFILPPWKAHMRKQIERVKTYYMDEQGGTTRIRMSSESRLKTPEQPSNERRSDLKAKLRKKHKLQRQARKKNR